MEPCRISLTNDTVLIEIDSYSTMLENELIEKIGNMLLDKSVDEKITKLKLKGFSTYGRHFAEMLCYKTRKVFLTQFEYDEKAKGFVVTNNIAWDWNEQYKLGTVLKD